MADFYSDNFHATGAVSVLAGELAFDASVRPPVGAVHARERYKRMYIKVGTAAAIGERLVMGQFKSNDRMIELFVTSTANGGNGLADLGLYYSGHAHDGAVVDADCYCSALAINGNIARVDELLESGVQTNYTRGLTLWAQGGLSADPVEPLDLCFTMTQAVTVAEIEVVVEAIYTAAD